MSSSAPGKKKHISGIPKKLKLNTHINIVTQRYGRNFKEKYVVF
jgi:hypothetical protein